MNARTVLILGAGVYQLPLIRAARALGHRVVVCSIRGSYPGFAYADSVHYVDTTDAERVLEVARSAHIDGVCTSGTDVAVSTLGRIVDALSLPGISAAAARLTTDKLEMKRAFLKHGVRTARFEPINNDADVNGVFNRLRAPLVFKAVDSSGSRGVVRVDEPAGAMAAAAKARAVSRQQYCIAEEYLEGREFGAQAYVRGGEFVFVMFHGDIVFRGDTGVPVGHYVPFDGPARLAMDARVQLTAAVKALGLRDCAINADFIEHDERAYVLEIGARAGATCLAELVSVHYGIDYFRFLIEASLGERVEFAPRAELPCAALLLTSDTGGIIERIETPADPDPDILDISCDYAPGDTVRPFRVGPDRIGQIIVRGESVEDALEKLEDTKKRVRIVVRPPPHAGGVKQDQYV